MPSQDAQEEDAGEERPAGLWSFQVRPGGNQQKPGEPDGGEKEADMGGVGDEIAVEHVDEAGEECGKIGFGVESNQAEHAQPGEKKMKQDQELKGLNRVGEAAGEVQEEVEGVEEGGLGVGGKGSAAELGGVPEGQSAGGQGIGGKASPGVVMKEKITAAQAEISR